MEQNAALLRCFCSGMLGGADAQQRGRRGLGKRQSCCFPRRVPCPEPCTGHSLPSRSRQREQQEKARAPASHAPTRHVLGSKGRCRNRACPPEPVPCRGAGGHFPPLPQPLPSRWSILLHCLAPHQARRGPCSAGLETAPPSPGRELPRPALTHRRGGQRLPPHQLARPQPVEEVTELALGTQPGRGEDEPAPGRARRAKGFRGASGCRVSSKIRWERREDAQPQLPAPCGALRAVGAVAVGAAVGGLPAALPGDPGPHLHRDAGLRAPPDVATQLFGAALWKPRQGVSPGSARCPQTLLRDGHQTRQKNRGAVHGQSLPTCCSLPSFGTLFIVIYATFPWG